MKYANKKYLTWAIPLIAFGLFLALFEGISAKYIFNRDYYDNQAHARDAYVTIDILGDTNELDQLTRTIELYGGGKQTFAFAVQNYFDELRVSTDRTEYSISVESEIDGVPAGYTGWSITRNQAAMNTAASVLAGGSMKQDQYLLTMNDGYENGTEVTVTVAATRPYTKTMVLKFILYTDKADVFYRVEDSAGQAYATLVVMSGVEIGAEGLAVNWGSVNHSSNLLQVDTTDRYVHDSDMTLTTNNPGTGFLTQFTCTRKIEKDSSIQIYFFKKDMTKDYSTEKDLPVTKTNNIYTIYIREKGANG